MITDSDLKEAIEALDAPEPVMPVVWISLKRCSCYDGDCHTMTNEQISSCAEPGPDGQLDPPDGYCPMLRRN